MSRGKHAKVGIASKVQMAHRHAPDNPDEDQVIKVAKLAHERGAHPKDIWPEVAE